MRSSNPVLGRAFNQRGYAAFDPSTINSDPAALALNVDEDLQSKTGPLTEAHLLNMLEIACMKVENIIQEKTQNLNAKIT